MKGHFQALERCPCQWFLSLFRCKIATLMAVNRKHCKCSYAIYLPLAWKFTRELLSLQAKILRPLPPPYLYIVKIENAHPILTPSLRKHCMKSTGSNWTVACSEIYGILTWPDQILICDPVLVFQATFTSVVRGGIAVHRFGEGKKSNYPLL